MQLGSVVVLSVVREEESQSRCFLLSSKVSEGWISTCARWRNTQLLGLIIFFFFWIIWFNESAVKTCIFLFPFVDHQLLPTYTW